MLIKCLLISYLTGVIICKSSILYNLTSGTYEAIEVKLSDTKTVHRLMNIPYAARTPNTFNKAHALLNRTDDRVHQADQWPSMCVQTRIFNAEFYGNLRLPHKTYMSFDCLTISLYIPAQARNLSAMMFIHGGSNAVGTSSYVDASALASYGDVVVAAVNYRLDVMGFFNMPNSDKYKGNYGLWDQLTAIKWLYHNCDNIGCNKDSITLFGHSAGSANVLFHSLSKHARPYVKRIIMQSGSGLAHWATNYEKYLLNLENSDRSTGLFRKTRYANTVYDTLINFLYVSKCNQTLKVNCLKERLNLFMQMNKNFNHAKLNLEISRSKSKSDKIDLLIMKSFWNLVNIVSFNDLSIMFGYIFKLKFESILNEHKTWSRDDLKLFSKRFNSDESSEETRVVSRMKNFLKEKNPHGHQHSSDEEACFVDLQLLIENYENTYEICFFLKEVGIVDTTGMFAFKQHQIISHGDDFIKSRIFQFFLSCFTDSYASTGSNLFQLNDSLILNELEQCANAAIDWSPSDFNEANFVKRVDQDWNDYELFSDYEEEEFRNADNSIYGGPKSTLIVKEIAWLSDNINNLHRANIDYDYIEDFPHFKVNDLDMDLMIGITRHESFYFLEFNYILDDILKHTFIYSSLLNLTSDLIDKLTILETNTQVNMCLKKKLLSFYNINTHYLKHEPNGLVKDDLALNLIDDFEFVLPMITHLKLRSDKKNLSTDNRKLYAYQFNFRPSFNYMLTKSMPYSDVYRNVYEHLNGNIVPHFSELDYMFGMPILSRKNLIRYKSKAFDYDYSQTEYDLSILMMKYWSNFAKYG